MNEVDSVLALRRLRSWQQTNGGELFPTFASLEWFTRKHRARLVESGQYLIRRGSSGSLVGPRFDHVVLEILKEEGLREIAMEAAA